MMNTTLLTLLTLLSLAQVVLGWIILRRHRRNVRHHCAAMPVIGRDHRMTETLHARLRDNAPGEDWRHPQIMRGKIAAWCKTQIEEGKF